jgi:anti-sigma-K factor RskA
VDTREYIGTGTLELYVAGLLSVEEMRDVELKACQYPEIKTVLESLQGSLEKYANKYAMQPPPGLKERIMKVVEGEGESERGKTKTIVREISPPRQFSPWFLAAASVVLLIVASIIAFRYASQVTQYKQQVAQLTEQQSSMQKEMEATKESMTQYAQQLAMLSDPNTVKIAMKGTPKSPESLAMIYWNKQSQTVYLDIKNLPPAPSDKQYQLWFIDPSNKPVSAGVFDMKTGEWIRMVNAPAAVAFAVTLEPRGGSVNPTMDQMYVIGMVSS